MWPAFQQEPLYQSAYFNKWPCFNFFPSCTSSPYSKKRTGPDNSDKNDNEAFDLEKQS